MSKIATFTGALLVFTSALLYADITPLSLQCSVSFSDFDQIDHTSKSGKLTLLDKKHRPGGMLRFTQTKDYEFWVMTHSVQSINNQSFINNFQVAIKHKKSRLFMHALSDTSHSASSPPHSARISLIDYHPNSSLEKGELLFECLNIN